MNTITFKTRHKSYEDMKEHLSERHKQILEILKNKEIKKVSCANAITYDTNEDGSISTYYLQLYFNVRGGN